MGIVAITREMGSLGTFIGAEVAKRLDYEFIRPDITREAAREYRVLEERLVEAVEERPGLFELVGRSARRYQAFVAAEVLEAVARGRAVIIGRWATLLLRGVRHAVRVRVCAPREVRVARLMERLGVDRAEAARRIEQNDEGVRARMRQVFDVEWSDPLLYDLTINTAQVALETGVAEILALVAAPEFQPTEASRREVGDRLLAARVRAALKAHRETERVEVEVRAQEGRVALSGTVASAAEREAALRVARGVTGVQALEPALRTLEPPTR
jgi:cytidylate kinase